MYTYISIYLSIYIYIYINHDLKLKEPGTGQGGEEGLRRGLGWHVLLNGANIPPGSNKTTTQKITHKT